MEENDIKLAVVSNDLSKPDTASIWLQDKYGAIVTVNESLLKDNHIPVENGIIHVSIDLYKAWFGDSYKKKEPPWPLKKFVDNMDFILASKNIIFSKAKIFMAELPFSYFASSWTGCRHLTLGILLKAWESDKLDYQCPYCNNMLKLLYVGGFLGSGTHSAMGYCFSCKRVNRLQTDCFLKYHNKFGDVYKQYNNPGQVVEAFTFEEALAVIKYLNER
jgi:hypothetical protein